MAHQILTAALSLPHVSARRPEDSYETAHISEINEALKEPGIVVVSLGFRDLSSQYLQNLVFGLGRNHKHGPPITHSSTRGCFWDIRPNDAEVHHKARSETKLDFPWHTDCSFESHPPQFFALHVLHADRRGGGTLSVLNASKIMLNLDISIYESLLRPEYSIKVPPEFFKGTENIIGGLVTKDGDEGSLRIRYRADIVEPLSSNAKEALQELNKILASKRTIEGEGLQIDFTPQMLPDDTVVLVDNGRWLHSRTAVMDPDRHLRRIRWARKEFTNHLKSGTMSASRGLSDSLFSKGQRNHSVI